MDDKLEVCAENLGELGGKWRRGWSGGSDEGAADGKDADRQTDSSHTHILKDCVDVFVVADAETDPEEQRPWHCLFWPRPSKTSGASRASRQLCPSLHGDGILFTLNFPGSFITR